MSRYILLFVLLFPAALVAGESIYSCKINEILELSDQGIMEKHIGAYKQLIGQSFSVNRTTGEMVGLPFDTQASKQVAILDNGSKENSYKAIVTSYPPNIWVKYIYIAEHQQGIHKSFWGTDDGNKIFSGLCS